MLNSASGTPNRVPIAGSGLACRIELVGLQTESPTGCALNSSSGGSSRHCGRSKPCMKQMIKAGLWLAGQASERESERERERERGSLHNPSGACIDRTSSRRSALSWAVDHNLHRIPTRPLNPASLPGLLTRPAYSSQWLVVIGGERVAVVTTIAIGIAAWLPDSTWLILTHR